MLCSTTLLVSQIGPLEEARANPIVSRCGSLTMRDVTAAGALDSDFDESAGEEEWHCGGFGRRCAGFQHNKDGSTTGARSSGVSGYGGGFYGRFRS